jgi:hypothetical protein
MSFEEMCESARMAHVKFTISKINQAILLIHDCVYTMDARIIRFELIDNVMTRQSQQFENIQKAYSSDDIGEEYIYSSIKPLLFCFRH